MEFAVLSPERPRRGEQFHTIHRTRQRHRVMVDDSLSADKGVVGRDTGTAAIRAIHPVDQPSEPLGNRPMGPPPPTLLGWSIIAIKSAVPAEIRCA